MNTKKILQSFILLATLLAMFVTTSSAYAAGCGDLRLRRLLVLHPRASQLDHVAVPQGAPKNLPFGMPKMGARYTLRDFSLTQVRENENGEQTQVVRPLQPVAEHNRLLEREVLHDELDIGDAARARLVK